MHIVIGLGNPGEKYQKTRHNVGRRATLFIENRVNDIKILIPDTFMNLTGRAVAKVVKSKKVAKKLIIIYDDLDLPIGSLKVSYNRGSGGHKGVESIIRALKTKEFIRLRIGIAPITPSGKIKKPKGEMAVEKHILGDFKKSEEEILKKVFKRVEDAVRMIVEEKLEKVMSEFNK
jgi:peptidyl-tRNA hydrolase, PTH1 family